MYRIVILFCFLWLTLKSDVYGQLMLLDQHYSDSLEELVRLARHDTTKVILLNQLSDFWSEKDSAKALSYARRSLVLSAGNNYLTAESQFRIAGAFFNFDKLRSQDGYQKVIELLEGDSGQRSLSLSSRAWHNLGALYQRQGDDKAYVDILLNKAIPLSLRANDTLRVAQNYAEVAMVFQNILDYKKAILYYKYAIDLANKLRPVPFDMIYFYSGLSANYLYDRQFNLARPYLERARKLLANYPLSYDHANYYMILGMYYSYTLNLKESLLTLDTAISMAEKLNQPYLRRSILFQKFKTYYRAELFGNARSILTDIYQDSFPTALPANRLLYLYNLAETESHLGNMYQAYDWLMKYSILADSLNEEKTKSEISELEIKYETEKNKLEIQALQNKSKQQNLLLQRNRLLTSFLITGIAVLLLGSTVIFISYKNKKRSIVQEKKLHEQELKQIAQEQQIKVYNAMLEGQEKERKRMAQDLHDGLGGMLAGVKLKLSDMVVNNPAKNEDELDKVMLQLDKSIDELRRIARNLMPETLIRFGLDTALKELCDSMNTPSLLVEFQSYQLDGNLPHLVQLTVYRIVQELITNAVKHSEASNILVQCSQNESRIFITIEDDGVGFDMGVNNDMNGIGMKNIKNRIDYLNGKLDITSSVEEGTIVNVEVNAYE